MFAEEFKAKPTNNLHVLERLIGSGGYTTITVPVIDGNRRTLLIYGDGNYDSYYGVIMFNTNRVVVNAHVLNNDMSVKAEMIGDHTLKITTWAWDQITIVANFEIS
jgi:hypothetical protein